MTAPRLMKLPAALYGEQYDAEGMKNCETADCFLTSSHGNSLWAHYSLVVDWLGSFPTPNERNQVVLPVSDDALLLLMNVIYHRRNFSWDSALEVIDFCKKHEWWELIDDLMTRGYAHIEDEGIIRCWMLSRKRNLACEMVLRQKVAEILGPDMNESRQGIDDFFCIPVEALQDLIEDDKVFWSNGHECANVIFAWSTRNPLTAKQHCKELFGLIRFSNILERRQLKFAYEDFFRKLGVAEEVLKDATNVFTSLKPRLPPSLLVYMGGWVQRKASEKSYFYDIYTRRWAPLPKLDLMEKLSYFKCELVNKKLYIIGGFSDGIFRPSLWKFDFSSLRWSPCAPLDETKGYFSVASMNNKIYVFGGSDGQNRLSSVDALDTVTNKWASLPPLSTGKSDTAALTFRNRIWILGGFDGTRTSNRVEAYDPYLNTYAEIAPMNEPRSGHCAVIFKEKIYVIGGFQHGRSTDSVEFYDSSIGQWNEGIKMGVPRSNFTAVVFEECIYVMGGHCSEESIANCEMFNGESWTPIHSLPKPIAAGAACFIEKPAEISKLLGRE